MFGEFFREVGVLVIVFAPLEWFVTFGALTPAAMIGIVVIVGPCFAVGMYLGLER